MQENLSMKGDRLSSQLALSWLSATRALQAGHSELLVISNQWVGDLPIDKSFTLFPGLRLENLVYRWL